MNTIKISEEYPIQSRNEPASGLKQKQSASTSAVQPPEVSE